MRPVDKVMERAENVRKRNYFAKYGNEARAVLSALLEKYSEIAGGLRRNAPWSATEIE